MRRFRLLLFLNIGILFVFFGGLLCWFHKISYQGKRISILGDSISTFGGSPNDDPRFSNGEYTYLGNRCRYPQEDLILDVHDMYWMKLIDEFNLTLGPLLLQLYEN